MGLEDYLVPHAIHVTPEKWSDISVLFDNNEYSVISGRYENGERRTLGERWNGDDERPIGFPNVAGNAVWHVVPDFLQIPILRALLDELARVQQPEYVDAIMRELEDRHRRQFAGA